MAAIITCKDCHATTDHAHGWSRLTLASRGGRVAYLCPACARKMYGYTAENATRRGCNIGGGFTYSIEFETNNPTTQCRVELQSFGWLPTSDCTVDVEFKSPIFNNLKPLPKKLQTIDRLVSAGHVSVGDNCGTHCHVGHVDHINATTMTYIGRFYHSLFVPLCEAMQADPEATARLFGRELGGWAAPITRQSWADEHRNFVNVEHSYTLEWRICKYRNAAQYMHAVKYCKDATAAIITNFILHFNDETDDPTAYRKHKAEVTARKLVKLFNKYAASVPTE